MVSRDEDSELLDVRQFHQKLGHLNGDGVAPRHLTRRKLAERANFLLEELCEFAAAAGLTMDADRENNLVFVEDPDLDPGTLRQQDLSLQADALVDLVYVAKGTADMLALPWKALWDDVQRANLAKVPGKTHRGNAVDAAKPPGWEGPQTTAILETHGYQQDAWAMGELQPTDDWEDADA
jgi:predicted HAD superfamily Cof-like phosphohydrolase